MSTRRELQVVISGVDKVSGPVAAAMSRIAATLDRVKAAVRPFGAAFDLTFGKALAGGRSVVSMLTSVRTMLLGVGAAVVANRFVGWVTDSVRELDEFGERARQLGVAVEWLSAAEYGAKLANEEIGSLGDALRKGMENLQEGLGERTGAVALLDRLGIKADDAEGKLRPLNQLVAELQKNLAGATQGERLDAFRDVFGRNGQVLERLTAGGAMERYASELERLGGTITSSQVEAASRLDDAMDRTSAAWRGIKHQFVEAVAEPVEVALNALSSALARVPDAVRGAGSLLTQWLQGYGTGSGIQAGDKLLDLLKAGGELMYDYIRGGFEVGWAVVTNGAASLLAWLSPKVSDMLQMAASKVLP
ncbi:MAG TPA: phage tail tape measure protein, partial [Phycisphaerales bacterium]|nr:phage tail tape measure protein [Phycisphaerales bacterium]